MYDELVKELRSHNGWALNETLDEAADAIEELSKRIDQAVDMYNRNIEKTAMYEALIGIKPEPQKEET